MYCFYCGNPIEDDTEAGFKACANGHRYEDAFLDVLGDIPPDGTAFSIPGGPSMDEFTIEAHGTVGPPP